MRRLALSLILAATPTLALAEIRFAAMTDNAPERPVVEALMGAAPEGVVYQTAVVDLDSDGGAEILVRLRTGEDCAPATPCRTLVAQHGPNGWRVVLDWPAHTVARGQRGFGGFLSLVTDGSHAWTWTGERYRLDVTRTGEAVTFEAAPDSARALLADQFGTGARKLVDEGKADIVVGAVDLTGAGAADLVARLEGAGACGRVYGCPMRVLRIVDGQYVTILDGFGSGATSVLPVARDGHRDIASELPRGGHAIFGWTGERYAASNHNAPGARR